MKTVYLYDTTLRTDPVRRGLVVGARQDRDRRKLDEFGITTSRAATRQQPQGQEFFERARKMRWKNSLLCAFG